MRLCDKLFLALFLVSCASASSFSASEFLTGFWRIDALDTVPVSTYAKPTESTLPSLTNFSAIVEWLSGTFSGTRSLTNPMEMTLDLRPFNHFDGVLDGHIDVLDLGNEYVRRRLDIPLAQNETQDLTIIKLRVKCTGFMDARIQMFHDNGLSHVASSSSSSEEEETAGIPDDRSLTLPMKFFRSFSRRHPYVSSNTQFKWKGSDDEGSTPPVTILGWRLDSLHLNVLNDEGAHIALQVTDTQTKRMEVLQFTARRLASHSDDLKDQKTTWWSLLGTVSVLAAVVVLKFGGKYYLKYKGVDVEAWLGRLSGKKQTKLTTVQKQRRDAANRLAKALENE